LPAAQRYASLVARLTASPEVIQDPLSGEIREFGADDLIATTLGGLYDAAIWPLLAAAADGIEQQLPPLELGARFAELAAAQQRSRYAGVEAFPAVLCTDSDGPTDPSAWSDAAAEGDANGYFGRPWTWASSVCAVWPFQADDRFVGPWGTSSAPPILITSNLHDPATPFSGAIALHDLTPNSYLVAVDGWGHVAAGTSTCADDALITYLVDLAPPVVTQCSPDYVPFLDPPLPFLFGG
jgi:hypothetical protein